MDLRKLRGKLGKLWSWQRTKVKLGRGRYEGDSPVPGRVLRGGCATCQPGCRNRERSSGGHWVQPGTHLPVGHPEREMLSRVPRTSLPFSFPPVPCPSQQNHSFLKNLDLPRPSAHLVWGPPPAVCVSPVGAGQALHQFFRGWDVAFSDIVGCSLFPCNKIIV